MRIVGKVPALWSGLIYTVGAISTWVLLPLSAMARPAYRSGAGVHRHAARTGVCPGRRRATGGGYGESNRSPALFKTNLRSCIESLTDGNVKRFCTATGMTYDSATHWLSVTGRIRLDLLIDICTQLDLSPLRFLTEPLAAKDFEHGRGLIHRNTSHIKTMRARVRLDEQLAGALNAEPPVSMHAVAAQARI